MLGRTSVDVLYIVDSFGSLYPEQIARIVDIYMEFAEKYNKKLGIHAHNNQHPRTAIRFTKDKRRDYSEFYREIVAQD